jgi:hypothetical protein
MYDRGGKGENLRCYQGKVSVQMEDDQLAQDISVRALLRNYHEGRPLVLLIDNKYILFPYDLSAKDVTYAVLGYYDITNAWGAWFCNMWSRSVTSADFILY